MVEFSSLDTDPIGPCRKLMRRQGDFIREMVSKSSEKNKEQVANFVEVEGKMAHTKMREGDEKSISARLSSLSMMDSMELADEIKETPGSSNINESKRYQVHTHPKGFAGLSVGDLTAYSNDIIKGANYPDADLVATMTEEGVRLGGAYIGSRLSDGEVAEIQTTITRINSEKIPMSKNQEETELIGAMERAGVSFCSVVFPE